MRKPGIGLRERARREREREMFTCTQPYPRRRFRDSSMTRHPARRTTVKDVQGWEHPKDIGTASSNQYISLKIADVRCASYETDPKSRVVSRARSRTSLLLESTDSFGAPVLRAAYVNLECARALLRTQRLQASHKPPRVRLAENQWCARGWTVAPAFSMIALFIPSGTRRLSHSDEPGRHQDNLYSIPVSVRGHECERIGQRYQQASLRAMQKRFTTASRAPPSGIG